MKNYKSDKPCIVCGEARDGYVTLHHIKTRGSGGSDSKHNLLSLCAKHHTMIHKIGLNSMIESYPVIREFLISNGWEDLNGRWFHD
jgi:predicted restriction endonuclease